MLRLSICGSGPSIHLPETLSPVSTADTTLTPANTIITRDMHITGCYFIGACVAAHKREDPNSHGHYERNISCIVLFVLARSSPVSISYSVS